MSTVGFTSRLLVVLGCLACTTLAIGQDDPAPPKTNKAAAASPEMKEFQALLDGRTELSKKLEALRADIGEAIQAKDTKKEQELKAQFDKLVAGFREKTLPKMISLATTMYIKDGKNAEAEDFVLGYMTDLFQNNKYKQVIAEGTKYMMAGRNNPRILNFVGVAHFANQDFAKAESVLTLARAAGEKDEEAAQLFAQLGGPYLGQCKSYAAMWKKELAIREKEAAAKGEERLPRVQLSTSKGDIELELFENEAPNAVANFISLVDKKYYDGIAFHRVIPSFMAQGGDPNTKDNDPRNDGQGGPGYTIKCEVFKPNARMHFQGSLSMAHAGRDTGGSQFFLTHLPTGHLNPDPDKDVGHTVFGRVVKGMDVVLALRPNDRITSAKVLFKRNHPYVPVTTKE